MSHDILNPAKKVHRTGDFARAEVMLANRNCGTLLETLHHDVTPIGSHYLLNHFDVPTVRNASDWQLQVCGAVKHPQTVTLNNIVQFANENNLEKTQRVTLECAGNGRAGLSPRWPSQPWQVEAVGTADWHGAPLHTLLQQCKILASGKEVVFYGADQGVDNGQVHHFARSLSVEHAMLEEVMLIWQMNGHPLLPQHGFPLRLIVPGWYGMASVKWLNKIEIIDHKFNGLQQTGTYVYKQNESDTGTPVSTIRPRALLVPPGIPDWSSRQRLIKPGVVSLTGRAWSGATRISRVEWACNDQWQEASLEPNNHRYAWSKWTAQWQANEGTHTLRCRATDANGNTQPLEAQWDRAGFGNNAVQSVTVQVKDYTSSQQ